MEFEFPLESEFEFDFEFVSDIEFEFEFEFGIDFELEFELEFEFGIPGGPFGAPGKLPGADLGVLWDLHFSMGPGPGSGTHGNMQVLEHPLRVQKAGTVRSDFRARRPPDQDLRFESSEIDT